MKIMKKSGYKQLVSDIGQLLENGRRQAVCILNSVITKTYWDIGKRIVEFEQEGRRRAKYGAALLEKLSADLELKYGKGFSRRNISDMRRFYILYGIWQTVSAKLSWSHYTELIRIKDSNERAFYEKQAIEELWGVRDLRRQINSGLFYRLLASKRGPLKLSAQGHIVKTAEDIIKDPYVLEFLGFSDSSIYSEKQMEDKIMSNLQMFLLELGSGFTFVARQLKLVISHKNFYADLVFYHKSLRCYVIIDLKTGALTSRDAGQMNLYLNYFKENINKAGDALPIGVIMARDKGAIEVKYALGGMSNKLFVSKYQLSLPSPEDLRKVVEKTKRAISHKSK